MPEADNNKDAKNYYLDVPVRNELFFLKGSNSYDWGMKNRLARIFNPVSGKAVMLAFDHGYFQGPTTGLERVDVTILPLAEYADALMLTRGILRTTIPASTQKPFVMRASGGPSILKELSNEQIAVDTEDALRMNASAVAVQVFIGAAGLAAHLPGVLASLTARPVIGVPLDGGALGGADALYAVVQMPPGVPVATVAIGSAGAKNAAHLAARILALADEAVAARVAAFRDDQAGRAELRIDPRAS